MTAANNGQEADDGQDNAANVRTRRKLGVCKGETHTLMLEEMLKGANVVISGDSGSFVWIVLFFFCWVAESNLTYSPLPVYYWKKSFTRIPNAMSPKIGVPKNTFSPQT